MRKRMTWNERMKKASPPPAMPGYGTPEHDHPADQPDPGPNDYLIGDGSPSTFAEDVHPGPYPNSAPPAMPTEDGDHPATKRAKDEKILKALERKASRCIKIAEFTLGPNAAEQDVEDHSLALMELPDNHINATLRSIMAEDQDEEADEDEDKEAKKKAAEDREADAMLEEMLHEASGDETSDWQRLATDLSAQLEGLKSEVQSLRQTVQAQDPVVVDEEEMMLQSMLEEESRCKCMQEDTAPIEETACGDNMGQFGEPVFEEDIYMDEEPLMDEGPMFDEEPLMDEEELMLDEMLSETDQNDPELGYTADMDESEAMLQEMLAEASREAAKAEDEEEVEEVVEEKEAGMDVILAEDPMGLMDDGSILTAEDNDLLQQLFTDKMAGDDSEDEEDVEEEVEEEEEPAKDEEVEVEVEVEEDEKEKEAKKKKKAASPKPKPPRTKPQVTTIGQMKTAGAKNEIDELSKLWTSAPDVSDVFKS